MIQLGDRPCLALETSEAIGVLSHSHMEHLDRHISIQPLVMRPIHHAHPACADLLDDAVVPESAADDVSPASGGG